MGNPLEEELSEADDYNNKVVRSVSKSSSGIELLNIATIVQKQGGQVKSCAALKAPVPKKGLKRREGATFFAGAFLIFWQKYTL